ncbi:hypothetical protein EPUS_05044 [Endocarpon pusillum Z07020]|uniref:AAA+ ATPase domain-containing protein n=1 Tax=Endocarpon pusillum (strain Z07020 / HMAS-L-300199) TaxID=1263415 RepID=U1GL67_ENDPU|nr:uncharacterized protein EPUS_05044 [Endocarpon pusillum Z07020]ERF72963.1 hypothetical protein EPUS_05044 [Endocarpon pusillum Z07020]
MRNKPGSSMQKTYDECYLICSTAVYFEGQNNEAEALRSWRSALDQIYYHNAYKLPTNYVPRSETEKALQDSLKQLEIQCKERVDLLEALKRSRKEQARAEKEAAKEARKLEKGKETVTNKTPTPGWIGEGSIPPVQYPDLSRPPALPPRPSFFTRQSSESMASRSPNPPPLYSSPLPTPPTLPVPVKKTSRSPSPDHKHKKTMLTTLRSGDRKSSKPRTTRVGSQGPAPLKAAGLAWDTTSRMSGAQIAQALQKQNPHDHTIQSRVEATASRRSLDQLGITSSEDELKRNNAAQASDPGDHIPTASWRDMHQGATTPLQEQPENVNVAPERESRTTNHEVESAPLNPPYDVPIQSTESRLSPRIPTKLTKPPEISYRKEFPISTLKSPPPSTANSMASSAQQRSPDKAEAPPPPPVSRKPLPNSSTPRSGRNRTMTETSSGSGEEAASHHQRRPINIAKMRRTRHADHRESPNQSPTPPSSSEATEDHEQEESPEDIAFERRKTAVLANLPKNVDLVTATQILNEVIVHGDEVHWSDVAGLDAAKKALKEAVVYPFLRPDLFMGLREPARGMLLFGPPGTGKTMLARAVATESKSTFFAISASSLTSKWHGESEKLVRALFAIARRMAPSIIFVDEIDSLLGTRGGGGGSEHEASRRSKTEFLIQWSDLQKAAAGKEKAMSGKGGDGDPTRVLVLAATNMPWDIDEAARRRFVRRQYIPLPEAETRRIQIGTLLGHQKHELSEADIEVLTQVTEGFSGSDITALAKDAAMGPLRKLGEALLYTPMDQIRPIRFEDFEASLENIRPSVSKAGLKAYEDWAREFGERGG